MGERYSYFAHGSYTDEERAKKERRRLEEEADRRSLGKLLGNDRLWRRRKFRAVLRAECRKLGIWHETECNVMQPNDKFQAAVAAVDPIKHKLRLERLYDAYMSVYEKGLGSGDLKIAIKCADIIRGMHIGTAGVGQPAADVKNAELMVLGMLPDIESGPTMGEMRLSREQELREEYAAADRHREALAHGEWTPPPKEPDPPGIVRLPSIEVDSEDEDD